MPGRMGPPGRPLAVPAAPPLPQPSESPPPLASRAGASAEPRASAPARRQLHPVCRALGSRRRWGTGELTRLGLAGTPSGNRAHRRGGNLDCHCPVTESFPASLMLVTPPCVALPWEERHPHYTAFSFPLSPASGSPRLLPVRNTWGALKKPLIPKVHPGQLKSEPRVWDPGSSILQSSPDDSNVHPGLRTTNSDRGFANLHWH